MYLRSITVRKAISCKKCINIFATGCSKGEQKITSENQERKKNKGSKRLHFTEIENHNTGSQNNKTKVQIVPI